MLTTSRSARPRNFLSPVSGGEQLLAAPLAQGSWHDHLRPCSRLRAETEGRNLEGPQTRLNTHAVARCILSLSRGLREQRIVELHGLQFSGFFTSETSAGKTVSQSRIACDNCLAVSPFAFPNSAWRKSAPFKLAPAKLPVALMTFRRSAPCKFAQ